MSIPDFETILLPLLNLLEDGNECWVRDIYQQLAEKFKLSEEEKTTLLPSGQQPLFQNRIGWATTFLKKAKLIESTRRGYYKITDRGISVLKENHQAIDTEYLKKFPEFIPFITVSRKKEIKSQDITKIIGPTPREQIENGYEIITESLANELINTVKDGSPYFFEKLVIDLLLKMGYGGSRKEAGETIGKTGDGGIDGIIKEDKLGLDVIYVQAKKWEGTVSRPEIQKFVGALEGKRARKGIFITTSNFSQEAINYVSTIGTKVILINGEDLARYMIQYDVGVSTISYYAIKQIDNDYFAEEPST
jgi:restriction system protein